MKKILLSIFLLFVSTQLFPQVTQFLSMGFNTFYDPFFGEPTYYFYGYDDYAEAMIDHRGALLLSTDETGYYIPGSITRYLAETYKRYNGQNGSAGYSAFLGATDDQGLEYIFKDGKLTYWSKTLNFIPYTTVNKIEQNSNRITIYTTIGSYSIGPKGERKYEYFNIPKTELLEKFLKSYVNTIQIIANEKDLNEDDIKRILAGRTKRELAIFRNCLFAMKGLRFQTQTWSDFFSKYLNGYNGRYSNAEVMEMFTRYEKWLLDLIIQFENRR
jgi:hypothetical protein